MLTNFARWHNRSETTVVAANKSAPNVKLSTLSTVSGLGLKTGSTLLVSFLQPQRTIQLNMTRNMRRISATYAFNSMTDTCEMRKWACFIADARSVDIRVEGGHAIPDRHLIQLVRNSQHVKTLVSGAPGVCLVPFARSTFCDHQ